MNEKMEWEETGSQKKKKEVIEKSLVPNGYNTICKQ
jgi:hypothetical protein